MIVGVADDEAPAAAAAKAAPKLKPMLSKSTSSTSSALSDGITDDAIRKSVLEWDGNGIRDFPELLAAVVSAAGVYGGHFKLTY